MNILNVFRRKRKQKNSSTIESTMDEKKSKQMSSNDALAQSQDPIEAMSKNIGSMSIAMKTYDIIVYDIDPDTGRQKQTPISGVKATSPQELVALYANCDQKIRILREYGDESTSQQKPQAMSFQQTVSQIQEKKTDVANAVEAAKETKQKKVVDEQIEEIIHSQQTRPQFFEVGGIKCKMENGHVYQEQWCRVDSSKYRLISDANNKEISMSGKHLETLKWVLIEESNGGN